MIPSVLSPLGNHLWQSTLFAAVAALLALALRRNRAPVRYAIWLAASVKFLIPFALLQCLGNQFPWNSARIAAPPLASTIEQFSQPFAPSPSIAATPAAPAAWPWFPALLALLWFAGCAAVIGRWWVRWRQVRLSLRSAAPLPIPAPIEVKSSPALLEPGIFGVLRPVLLLPEGIASRLTPEQFQAILAHELCHVRRRDNQTALLHMLVEALFWFHPIVWWIGSRLVEERERACDQEVLRLGAHPEDYASGILTVVRHYLESPLPCTSGVTGADLKKRIEAIMTEPALHSLTLARKLLLAAAGIGAVAGPVVIGIAGAPQGHTQTQGSPLRFEVASIKPVKDGGGRGSLQILPGGGLRMDGVNLLGLIALAYDVRETQVSGGPKWASTDSYNLLAKAEHSTAADDPELNFAPGTNAWNRLRLRTQTLLAERFQLVIRKDAKESPGYALVIAKGGFKLSESTSTAPAGTMRSLGKIDGRRGTMHMLAAVLTGYLGRPVEDRTGLTGGYDYKLEYGQDPGQGGKIGPDGPMENGSDPNGPSIFRALQEQLGLKVETSKVTTQTIVIEKAQKPSAN